MKKNFLTLGIIAFSMIALSSCQKNIGKTDNPQQNGEKNSLSKFFNDQSLDAFANTTYWNPQDDVTSGNESKLAGAPDPRLTSFTYLEAALEFTGLDAVVEGLDAYTLFAPSDYAFNMAGFESIDALLSVGVDGLTPILTYHVIGGAKVLAADVPAGPNAAIASVNGNNLYLTRRTDPKLLVLVDGSGVYIPDYDNGNGVVHCINRVLFPPVGTIVDACIANPDYSYLVAAVLRASEGSTDVAGVLSGTGPFTLFAPTNQAFINAGFPTIDDINAADPDVLAAILTYHVTNGIVFGRDIPNTGVSPVMLNGGTTAITTTIKSNGYRPLQIKGNSNAAASDIILPRNTVATNGVIHTIDEVLLP